MSIYDYLIDHQGFNWPSLLGEWKWLLPDEFTVWMMNRFGDLFIVLEDGSVHMFDVGGGSFEKVADSRDDFARRTYEGNNANEWFMIPLVDKLVARGITLKPGQCYSYKLPPVLGGDYTIDNSCVLSIPEHYSFYATIHSQIKDLPDGTEVVIRRQK